MNVHNHSNSEIEAYVFCQYYRESNEIKLAVSDYGIGIIHSVSKYLKVKEGKALSNRECIEWAIKVFNTTQSIPGNRGRGLNTITSFISANKSEWHLLNEDIAFHGKESKSVFKTNLIKGFKGTIVQITIKIENLEPRGFVSDFSWEIG
jgi:hypothetical protein